MKTIILMVIIVTMAISGCNTFKGLGKDIEDAGQGIQKASDKTRESIKK